MSRYVGRRRVELGIMDREVFVGQEHPPGAEAEVDFGEFQTLLDGVAVKMWVFVMRLSCSGKAFHVAYGNQAQEAFLEGHTAAFEHFGGVPGRIRYDNLKPAVTRVLKGRNRVESDRFVALRSHYGFDSFFCIPGKQGAHEKGGVEGEIGRFRRRLWCRCRRSPRWPTSPLWSQPAMSLMTIESSPDGPRRWGSRSLPSSPP